MHSKALSCHVDWYNIYTYITGLRKCFVELLKNIWHSVQKAVKVNIYILTISICIANDVNF